jgi:hypothetical protein
MKLPTVAILIWSFQGTVFNDNGLITMVGASLIDRVLLFDTLLSSWHALRSYATPFLLLMYNN